MVRKSISELLWTDEKFLSVNFGSSRWQKFKTRLYRSILIDKNHPDILEYFKSEVAVLREKKRHCEKFPYTIHPLSKFNQFYVLWCFVFYTVLVFVKTLDFGWITISDEGMFVPNGITTELLVFVTVLDSLALFQVWTQLFVGYCQPESRTVELSLVKIAKRCLLNGHFICDILSSIPRILFYNASDTVYIIVTVLTLLKLRRVSTCIISIKPVARMIGITSETKIFLITLCFIVSLVMHIATSFHQGIARFREIALSDEEYELLQKIHFNQFPIFRKYVVVFFKSAHYTLLINTPLAKSWYLTENLYFAFINFIAGKILLITVWCVLLQTFLEQRSLRINSAQILTELDEYMDKKQLPQDLRRKINEHYNFKYQKTIFTESLIRDVVSTNLKQDMNLCLGQSLIRRVSLFNKLPVKVVKNIINHLVSEICLPNDLIIHFGTPGDCMYFIESGTVAVFSPSNKEICHLKDGDYFGEISVLSKYKRTATVVAVEHVHLYRLDQKHFLENIRPVREVYHTVMETAVQRMRDTKVIEEHFKKGLFK